MPDAVEPVDPYYGAVRTAVPQGCTGLWQIGAHKHLLPSDTPHYDYFYVRRSSFALDLWILWRTALVMFHLGGPVEPSQAPRWALRASTVEPASTVIDLTDLLDPNVSLLEPLPELQTA
jgi:hypothetical protein